MGVRAIRDKTTQEERTQMFLDKKVTNKNVLSQFLSEPNVANFNKNMLNEVFVNRGGRPRSFDDITEDDLYKLLVSYFKLCQENEVIPTIATMCLYIGIDRVTLYEKLSKRCEKFTSLLQSAVDTCHSYIELGAISGRVPVTLFTFLATNYYGLTNTQQVNVKPIEIDDTINNSQTLEIIKEQITSEIKQNQDE